MYLLDISLLTVDSRIGAKIYKFEEQLSDVRVAVDIAWLGNLGYAHLSEVAYGGC